MKNPVIDYVVPMVFPSDPVWRHTLRRMGGDRSIDAVRYRSWNTEQFLVQCVQRFMPWVRDIIILLASEGQCQPWMTREVATQSQHSHQPRLRVVYHSEFMPKEALPTFNSRAMEMFLHRIPGIAPYIIYGNDDMIPLSPLSLSDFFRSSTAPVTSSVAGDSIAHTASSVADFGDEKAAVPDGFPSGLLPCQHLNSLPFPAHPNNFQSACMAGLNFVASEFGQRFTDTWLKGKHSLAPILRSSCEHLWQRGGNEIAKSLSPFRRPHNFNQYIYTWYQHLSGQYIDHTPRCTYTSVKSHTPQQMTAAILDPQTQIVCINDHECVTNIRPYIDMVCDAINRRLNASAEFLLTTN